MSAVDIFMEEQFMYLGNNPNCVFFEWQRDISDNDNICIIGQHGYGLPMGNLSKVIFNAIEGSHSDSSKDGE